MGVSGPHKHGKRQWCQNASSRQPRNLGVKVRQDPKNRLNAVEILGVKLRQTPALIT